MKIIDAHHHLWDTEALHYELFEKVPALRRPYRMADYEQVAVRHDVTSSICVEAASAGADGWTETGWLLRETSECRIVQRITAWAPIESPHIVSYMQRLKDNAGQRIAGIRRSFEFESSDFPQHPNVISGARLAGQFGYNFELVLFEHSLESALRLIESCPETRFILDHAGKPRIREKIDQPWRRTIATIAKQANVVCKISGLSTEADRLNWRKQDLRPYIDHAIECFGWDRVLFGSDWPVCNLARGFEPWLEAALWATQSAGEAERRKFFSENACRVYGLSASEGQHAG